MGKKLWNLLEERNFTGGKSKYYSYERLYEYDKCGIKNIKESYRDNQLLIAFFQNALILVKLIEMKRKFQW